MNFLLYVYFITIFLIYNHSPAMLMIDIYPIKDDFAVIEIFQNYYD